MDAITITGYIAGTLTTVSFIPQVARAWRMKETRDISLAMLLLFAAGVALWTLYGFFVSSFPVIAANIVTFLLIVVLVSLKVKYH